LENPQKNNLQKFFNNFWYRKYPKNGKNLNKKFLSLRKVTIFIKNTRKYKLYNYLENG